MVKVTGLIPQSRKGSRVQILAPATKYYRGVAQLAEALPLKGGELQVQALSPQPSLPVVVEVAHTSS